MQPVREIFNLERLNFEEPIGGDPAVNMRPLPHEVWPPEAAQAELDELASQRNRDIHIAGRAGPVAELENRFLKFMEGQVNHAVSFNSGTSALLAAYFSLGLKDGDEVIGPALTYHAALSPMRILGAVPVLADIDPDTRCIDPKDIERRITPNTKAITVVHQWGHPADMDAILEIARKHNLKVVEDCSHAHGSRYKGRLCGSMGDVAAFSLQTNKAIFAGEGGMFVTNSPEFHDRATLLGHYRDRSRKEVIDPNLQRYWETGFGLKLRMSPFNAIVAKHSMDAFPQIKEGRHACLTYFTEQLRQFPFIKVTEVPEDVDMGAWYGFKPLYLPEQLYGLPRDAFINALRAEGMEISVPSGSVLSDTPLYSAPDDPLLDRFRGRAMVRSEDLPNAAYVGAHALSLPTFYDWEKDKALIDQYIFAIRKVYEHVHGLVHQAAPVNSSAYSGLANPEV